jgi:hypothetical protein
MGVCFEHRTGFRLLQFRHIFLTRLFCHKEKARLQADPSVGLTIVVEL